MKVRVRLIALLSTVTAAASLPVYANEVTPADMVDALNAVFGRHPGARASHAKGFCARGSFIPSADAVGFAASRLLGATQVPAEVRFSIGGCNPKASDKSRSLRGIAVRLTGKDESWDMVFVSEPVFFAATPESFVSFLQSRTVDPATSKPDPSRIKAHIEKYPEGTRQLELLAAHAAPTSYANTAYHSNHAFRFVGAEGHATWARLQFEPVAGVRYLTADEEKTFPDEFLEDEFKSRLVKGSVDFELFARRAGKDDSLTDPSSLWSSTHGKIRLGRLSLVSHTGQGCNDLVYLPTRLPSGVEPSEDRLLKMRAAAYAISSSRRSAP